MKHLARLFIGFIFVIVAGLVIGLCVVNPIIFAILFISIISYAFGAMFLLEFEMDNKK